MLTSVHPPLDSRIFHRQARSMQAAGFDVLLIAPSAPVAPIDGVRFSSLPAWGGRAGRPLRWPLLFIKALRAGADIYHFHDPELLPWGLLLKWMTGSAVVYDSHEYLSESMLSKHWIPAPLRRPAARVAGGLEKWVAHRLDAVVVVTDEMAESFIDSQPEVVTIRNLPPAPRLADGDVPRRPVVIHAGIMNVESGLSILEDTARLVRRECPSAEFHVLGSVQWFGMPPGSQAREDWAEAGVQFLGQVPQPEVAPLLAAASVGWLPRDATIPNNLRAWPNKLVEYMAVALPVVASDLPTQAAVIHDADCGILVEANSARAHADAIIALLEDPSRARALGENGRRIAAEKYTWDAEATKLSALYGRLLARTSK